jgi:hypothetical protein
MRKFLCFIGFHRWRDLYRENETMGQRASERCLDCDKQQSVFRLLHYKDKQPMHPLAEKWRRNFA